MDPRQKAGYNREQFFNNCLLAESIPNTEESQSDCRIKTLERSSLPQNYRPISLLSHLHKLLERLLLKRLIPVAEKYVSENKLVFVLVNQPLWTTAQSNLKNQPLWTTAQSNLSTLKVKMITFIGVARGGGRRAPQLKCYQ